MTGAFPKEMGVVPILQNMHPRMTMFDNKRPGIGSMVNITDQAEITTQAWLDS